MSDAYNAVVNALAIPPYAYHDNEAACAMYEALVLAEAALRAPVSEIISTDGDPVGGASRPAEPGSTPGAIRHSESAPSESTQIKPMRPYVLPVVPPVRFDHIAYEGEIWYDSTGRMLQPEEVCHWLNSLAKASK